MNGYPLPHSIPTVLRSGTQEVRQPWSSRQVYQYLHTSIFKADPRWSIATIAPQKSFSFSAVSCCKMPVQVRNRPKVKSGGSSFTSDRKTSRRETTPPPQTPHKIDGALHSLNTIQSAQFPDLSSPFSRWLSRSRRAFRLFSTMAHELQSFNGDLFLLYCFLIGGEKHYKGQYEAYWLWASFTSCMQIGQRQQQLEGRRVEGKTDQWRNNNKKWNHNG